ncbi:MAG TPA: type II toxin-antitoxin system RelE/ParE family toxin, partial [Acidobacteriaceae bacterium]|nr:type II toxin-antitoxin system RelE/ParE family toxin [Acidobacteriaceae bacterium]
QAALWLRKIHARMEAIARQPKLYRLRPEIGRDARIAVEGDYLILFRILDNETVRMERVVHGSRDLPKLFEEFRLM